MSFASNMPIYLNRPFYGERVRTKSSVQTCNVEMPACAFGLGFVPLLARSVATYAQFDEENLLSVSPLVNRKSECIDYNSKTKDWRDDSFSTDTLCSRKKHLFVKNARYAASR